MYIIRLEIIYHHDFLSEKSDIQIIFLVCISRLSTGLSVGINAFRISQVMVGSYNIFLERNNNKGLY